jgi:type 2 lantibiotic biosynthesis protein LanM
LAVLLRQFALALGERTMALDNNWCRALTLAERLGIRQAAPERSGSSRITERGQECLAKWKAQAPFNADSLFQQRLAQSGLTEGELLELLSAPVGPSPVQARVSLAWSGEIVQSFADSNGSCADPVFQTLGREPQNRFLELARPLINRTVRRLRERMELLQGFHVGIPFDANSAVTQLVKLLPGRLLPVLLRTMVLELNVARVRGWLEGSTSEERFDSFVARIQEPRIALELLREYPVLARQIVVSLEHWFSSSLEFLQRWCADWPAIRALFSPNEDPGPLVGVQGNAGDSHRGGRTVWILECRSGLKVVYKPRSLAVDAHFQEMLGWLNREGCSVPFLQLRMLDRGSYGWEEFVSPQTCSSREEVARFYTRAGEYLALLYSLAATDFHLENIVAAGEQPVLVDLEALFHARGLEPDPTEAGDLAAQSFTESVLGSGLLPAPMWAGRDGDFFDLSGLGARKGEKLPVPSLGLAGQGTDEMRFARESRVIESTHHQPTLNGGSVNPLDYLDAMEQGFKEVYELLISHRNEVLASGGLLDRFASDEVRVVLRNTSRYAQLLQESFHPDFLRDGLDRDRLFDRLWVEVKNQPRMGELVASEVEDLWRGDVPLFTTCPDSRDLWADGTRRFTNVLAESGLERARRRVRQMGPEDLKRQLWFLRGSLTTLASGPRAVPRPPPQTVDSNVPAQRDELLAACCAIGDRLADKSFHGAGDITWIGLNTLRENRWVLVPLGLDLYDGVPGIGLFLAYLGKISGLGRYTVLARSALETLRQRLRPDRRQQGWSEIGGFIGWGGVLYTLAHLGTLWNEPALYAEAEQLVELLPERIANDKKLDIIGGAAGCIAGLLCLQRCNAASRVLEIAVQCGDHLLANARQMPQGLGWDPQLANSGPLTGFSHGAAGISWALLELAAATGEDRFRAAALEGIAYERSLFSAPAGNWPDLRGAEGTPRASEPAFVVAWCHGAPGIGLARLLCRRHLEDPALDNEIQAAVNTTLANGFGGNHSLCHGDLGNLELLREAAHAFPGSTWGAQVERITARVLSGINKDGWLCGNPLAVESPGLMTGIAGIGYGLLRCAEPLRVPSVLALASPNQALKSQAE